MEFEIIDKFYEKNIFFSFSLEMQKTVEMMFKNFQIVYISSKYGQLLMELPNKDIGIEFLYIENGIF